MYLNLELCHHTTHNTRKMGLDDNFANTPLVPLQAPHKRLKSLTNQAKTTNKKAKTSTTKKNNTPSPPHTHKNDDKN